MKILLIDDNKSFAEETKTILTANGFSVDIETDSLTGLQLAIDGDYNAIVLDVMMPSIDGIQVCKSIRKQGINTPILMLTAFDDKDRRCRGLDEGADDYLTKPCYYPELISRLNALIRRSLGYCDSIISIDELQINISESSASYKGERLKLSSKEFEILKLLAMNANHVMSKETIQYKIWDTENEIYSNVVEVLIGRLRNKIDPLHKDAVIKTVYNMGYRIEK
jgi:two-component system copper resistance phosphate regulon response regulator CusR